ncbi:MAG: ATP-binding protein [Clostridiales Family XIII bacterium]|jgi:predicted AAA+ superfamily ATPase|nr:ATP-binding protein [Clostridiales Family XIII bacterium]
MDKNTIKKIIIENHEYIERISPMKREIYIEGNGNYVFVGSRRAGKTFLMFNIIKDIVVEHGTIDEILYINFEDERLLEMTADDFDLIIEAYHELFDTTPIFFLDEIQVVDRWDKFVRRLADTGFRIYVTGSNAQMLSHDIATTLGGRFLVKEVYPFSFKEFLTAKDISLSKNWIHSSQRYEIRKQFDMYFMYGGFPEVQFFTEKREWLDNLYQKIFYGDLISRYKIRNDFALKLLIKKLAESVQADISFNRMANIIKSSGTKIGSSTVIEYITYLEESYLIMPTTNYLSKITERETAKKYYFCDNGILSLFLIKPHVRLLENIVACELTRRGEPLYFAKDGDEVDFYIPDKSLAIQVCYNMNDLGTQKRELVSMHKINKQLHAKNLLIITMDEDRVIEDRDGDIQVKSICKWLLEAD